MKTGAYDIGLGWVNPVEEKFVESCKKAAKAKQFSFLEITYENFENVFEQVRQKRIFLKTFIDRASLDDSAFFLLAYLVQQQGGRVLNDPVGAIRASSKANLHALYAKAGLPVLKTVILSAKQPAKQLERIPKILGVPFVLKPSHGGAGEGVFLAAKNTQDIHSFLKDLGSDEGLAQEYIRPALLAGKTAWFRPVYAAGESIPLWWDPQNHFYQEFKNTSKERAIASKLKKFTATIAKLTGLELFSCEVMMTERHAFFIVDYANHPIDLNTQEAVPDGLPPRVLERVVRAIIQSI